MTRTVDPMSLARDERADLADRLRCALDFARTAPPIGAARRISGLALVATDLDWTAGSGPVVEGPAESLLMAIAGRPGSAPELTGPGQATLALRLGCPP